MEKEILLSVIIPVYNAEKYVKRAVKSLIRQPNFSRIEVLLVDDGSKDESGAICDDMANEHDNIRVWHKENGGVSSARNLAIKNARGRYCAFLDADDWYEKDFFTDDIMSELDKGDTDIFGFGYRLITSSYKHYVSMHPVETKTMEEGYYYDWRMMWSYMYKISIIRENEIEFWPVCINEDFSFSELCFCCAKRVKYIDKYLYAYWQNPRSVSHKKNPIRYYEEFRKSLDFQAEWFSMRGRELQKEPLFLSYLNLQLPDICARHTYQEVKSLIETDENFKLLDRVDELARWEMGNVKEFNCNPKEYCAKQRRKLLPKLKFLDYLSRHEKLQAFVENCYSVIKRRVKIPKETYKDIKNLSKQ